MAIDIIFLISAAYGFYLGFSKGIISTVFTAFSFVFGLMAGFKFAPRVTEILKTTFSSENPLMFIAGFLLTFIGTMLIIRMLAKGMEGIMKTARINIINQVFGGALLAGVMILVYSVVLWFGDQSHIINNSTKQESLTYRFLEPFPSMVFTFGKKMKPAFQEFWAHSLDVMDRIEDMSVQRTESDPTVYDIDEENDRRPKANKPIARKRPNAGKPRPRPKAKKKRPAQE